MFMISTLHKSSVEGFTRDLGLAKRRILFRGRGGIGRRAALRSLWGKTRGSSNLLGRTTFPDYQVH